MVNRKTVRLILSDIVIADSIKESKYILLLRIYNLLGAVIAEEMFFRLFLLTMDIPIYIAAVLSIVYFPLAHYIMPWGDAFTRQDYINQIAIGTISTLLFVMTKSILSSIILHLLMNSIRIMACVKRIDRHYLRVEKYDKLMAEESSVFEL
jgi:membrane protease YdiL (CAAX protease family)